MYFLHSCVFLPDFTQSIDADVDPRTVFPELQGQHKCTEVVMGEVEATLSRHLVCVRAFVVSVDYSMP